MSTGLDVELHVPDFTIVRTFNEGLGFKVAYQTEGVGPEGYLVMFLDNITLRFWPGNESIYEQSYFRDFPRSTRRGYGVELVLSVNNLDVIYQRAQALGAVVEEMQMQPWGLRDFRIKDPNGYYLRWNDPHDGRMP